MMFVPCKCYPSSAISILMILNHLMVTAKASLSRPSAGVFWPAVFNDWVSLQLDCVISNFFFLKGALKMAECNKKWFVASMEAVFHNARLSLLFPWCPWVASGCWISSVFNPDSNRAPVSCLFGNWHIPYDFCKVLFFNIYSLHNILWRVFWGKLKLQK